MSNENIEHLPTSPQGPSSDIVSKKQFKPNPFFIFLAKIFKDSTKWFFRGLASCASMSIGFMMVSIAMLLVLIGISASSELDQSGIENGALEVFRNYGGEDKIALIELNGVIIEQSDESSPFGSTFNLITPDRVETSFNKARNDDKVKAVILYINSPGGSPVASDRIYEIINDYKKDTNEPVVVLMGDVAASGGYYIASAADRIYANPSTITGSIGVILETYNLSGLYEKVGVKKEVFKAGRYKDILSDARSMTAEEKEMIQDMMFDAYSTFLKRVSDGRKMPINELSEKAEGRIYSGISAKEAGLIDDIGTMNSVISYTAERANLTNYQVVKIKSHGIFSDLFTGVKLGLIGNLINVNVMDKHEPSYKILYKMP